jgi:hypothetical protein
LDRVVHRGEVNWILEAGIMSFFEWEDDARRVRDVLGKRLAKYGLTLHPERTRRIPFRRPPKDQHKGKGPGIFDFLGFTMYWRQTRSGRWEMACKTRRAWYKWLCRRSQRSRLIWGRFKDLLRDFPLPQPRDVVRIWGM